MNQYLLLRDNKQTGPYSAQQLSDLGLKPYDLVWQEGKSAAWRYPSELDELKSFAPVVEEQPFDRFYKKSGLEQHAGSQAITNEASESKTSDNESYKPVPRSETRESYIARNKPTKIFVTLPPDHNKSGAKEVLPESKPVSQTYSYSQKPMKPDPDIHSKIKTVKTSTIPLFPDVSDKKAAEESEPQGPPRLRMPDLSAAFAGLNFKTSYNSSALLKGLVAVCLILTFVLLAIYFTGRNDNSRQLDAMVKQIQERNANLNKTGKVQTPVLDRENFFDPEEKTKVEDLAEMEPEAPPTTITRQAVIKTPASSASTAESLPPEDNKTRDAVTATAQSSSEDLPKKEILSKETAIKNLFQMVHLSGSDYKTGVLGGISNLQLTISNKSNYQ